MRIRVPLRIFGCNLFLVVHLRRFAAAKVIMGVCPCNITVMRVWTIIFFHLSVAVLVIIRLYISYFYKLQSFVFTIYLFVWFSGGVYLSFTINVFSFFFLSFFFICRLLTSKHKRMVTAILLYFWNHYHTNIINVTLCLFVFRWN